MGMLDDEGELVNDLHTLCPSLCTINHVGIGNFRDSGLLFSWDGETWTEEYYWESISLWDVAISRIMPYGQRPCLQVKMYTF
jgi:hypothetical protein